MAFFDWVMRLLGKGAPNPTIGASVSVPLESGYTKPPEIDSKKQKDVQLTQNFSLFEMTKTDHTELQAANRDLTQAQIFKLTMLAELLETVRTLIGVPISVHDGFRCPALNKEDGGVSNSQHALCEAADWTPVGVSVINDVYPVFKRLWDAAKQGKFTFGQLIFEETDHGTAWVHLSLGKPYRDPIKCNQVLIMRRGCYELLERV